MTYGNNDRLSKNERREAAREKARVLREEHRKKERRTKVLVQGGIILASLAIIAVIALVIVNSIRPAGPGPANMASDGIQLTQGAIATETRALSANAKPVPHEPEAGVLDIQMYVDYLCPFCGAFELTNGAYITSLLDNGNTTVEIHPIAILDHLSQGTRYSTRAVNAVACVADTSPNQFFAMHNLLFTNQPEEQSAGLSDDELVALAQQAGVADPEAVETCIRDQEFRAWVKNSTDRAKAGPIPNSDVAQITGTPTVIVNGQRYQGPVDDLASFQAFVVQVTGNDFVENSTPTPTPTPTP